MQFQMSVFFNGYYVSYQVTTDDKNVFHFTMKSKPDNATYAPDNFNATRADKDWNIDTDLDPDFKKDLVSHLKKFKV